MRAILLFIVPLVLAGVAAISTTAPTADPAAAPSTGPTTIASTAPTTGPTRSVLDGVYSADQLARGQKAYLSGCARCHGENLLGNDDAPALIEKDFLNEWNGKPLEKLVEVTWKKMPTDGPGRLSRKQSTDITAYLLNENGFPVGKTDLSSDANVLNGILFETKK
jgi:mono/diheme cytochrome c family protein